MNEAFRSPRPAIAVLAFAMILVPAGSLATLAADSQVANARQAFEFAYEDVNPNSESHGQKVALRDLFKAEGVVLNFIASWCPPCWQEIPHFAKIDEQITTPVVFIAADEHDGPKPLLARLQRFTVTQPVLMVPPRDIAMLEQHYDHAMLPSTYMIDKDGGIRQVLEGMITENSLIRATRIHFPRSGSHEIPLKDESREGTVRF